MPPTADLPSPPQGILIVTIDRLPAWMLSAWGATWVASPATDAIAARGVAFDRLITTSLDPQRTARDLLGQGDRSLLARAVAAGRRVAVISDQPAVVEAVAPPAGAEVTIVAARLPAEPAADESATNLGRLFGAAAQVLADRRPEVVWLHVGCLGIAWDAPLECREAYLDPDDPPPPPGCRVPNGPVEASTDPDVLVAVRHVFAAQVTLLDRCLGRLVAQFDAQFAATGGGLLLVAGLRGLPLGLHSWMGGEEACLEERLPYGETIHVPAILVDSASLMAGQRYGGLATPADLGATVCELAGWGTPERAEAEPWRGCSLAGLMACWQAAARDRVVVRGPAGDAVVTPAWHCIKTRAAGGHDETLLFAKPDDFFELANVADRCRDVAEELAGILGEDAGADVGAAWRTPLSEAAQSGPQ